jgi:hypothetical protein
MLTAKATSEARLEAQAAIAVTCTRQGAFGASTR